MPLQLGWKGGLAFGSQEIPQSHRITNFTQRFIGKEEPLLKRELGSRELGDTSANTTQVPKDSHGRYVLTMPATISGMELHAYTADPADELVLVKQGATGSVQVQPELGYPQSSATQKWYLWDIVLF